MITILYAGNLRLEAEVGRALRARLVEYPTLFAQLGNLGEVVAIWVLGE